MCMKAVLAELLALLTAQGAIAGAPYFTGLGGLEGGSADHSYAWGISDDGNVAIGEATSSVTAGPFRWTAQEGMKKLGMLNPGGDMALGANFDGSVIVGGSGTGGGVEQAFRWTAATGMVPLGDLPGGEVASRAFATSADGNVVVGYSKSAAAFSWEAFRWTATDGMIGLGDLPGGVFESRAFDVSANGDVIVGRSVTAAGSEAFRWTPGGGMASIGDLDGGVTLSSAFAISEDGNTVVGSGSTADGEEAFVWTASSGMVGLGDLPGGQFRSVAYGVSGDGSRVVGEANTALSHTPFIWDAAHGMRDLQSVLTNVLDLDLTGWSLERATGISADGTTVVGFGRNPAGDIEGWVARIPEPSSLVLLMGLGTMLAKRGWADEHEATR